MIRLGERQRHAKAASPAIECSVRYEKGKRLKRSEAEAQAGQGYNDDWNGPVALALYGFSVFMAFAGAALFGVRELLCGVLVLFKSG